MVRLANKSSSYQINRRSRYKRKSFFLQCCTQRSIFMLSCGVLVGYLIIPFYLSETTYAPEDFQWNSGIKTVSNTSSSLANHDRIGSHKQSGAEPNITKVIDGPQSKEKSKNMRGATQGKPKYEVKVQRRDSGNSQESQPDYLEAGGQVPDISDEQPEDHEKKSLDKDDIPSKNSLPTEDGADVDVDAFTVNHAAGKKEDYMKYQQSQQNNVKALENAQSESGLITVQQRNAYFSSQSVPTTTTPYIMKTSKLADGKRMKILVTGGAGFVGSHLVDLLMQEGHEVIVLDNFFTGQKRNIEHWLQHPNFSFRVHDVTEPITLEVDQIYHLACPASPPHYQYNPVKTIKTSIMGTLNMLGLAKRVNARMLLTSTSEIYGDPKEHPQKESYWGNVNTVGPRSCYDEGKRVAETMMYSYHKQNNVDIRIARIFNTFGPRMHPNDGRVVSNFIIQALQNKPLTIYGDGSQTRSFQYVSDLVQGLHALMNGSYDMPVNLGNPDEYSVKKFAEHIKEITQSQSDITYLEKSQDDPTQRKPAIEVAKREIGWEPKVDVEEGLKLAIDYFQNVLKENGEIIPTGPGAAKPKGSQEGGVGKTN